jgi:hypothetical protein
VASSFTQAGILMLITVIRFAAVGPICCAIISVRSCAFVLGWAYFRLLDTKVRA